LKINSGCFLAYERKRITDSTKRQYAGFDDNAETADTNGFDEVEFDDASEEVDNTEEVRAKHNTEFDSIIAGMNSFIFIQNKLYKANFVL
jgi:hypothetical protein